MNAVSPHPSLATGAVVGGSGSRAHDAPRLLGRPGRPCVPGCPNLRPCAVHPPKSTSGTPGYGRGRALRREVASQPCVGCGSRVRVHADHVVPRKLGGSDARENLQPLCQACHNRKTARDRKRRKAS